MSLEEKIAAAIASVKAAGAVKAADEEVDHIDDRSFNQDDLSSSDEVLSSDDDEAAAATTVSQQQWQQPPQQQPSPPPPTRETFVDAPSNIAGAGGPRSFLDDYDDDVSVGSARSSRSGARRLGRSATRSPARSVSRGSTASVRTATGDMRACDRLHQYGKTKARRMKKKRQEHMRERFTFKPTLVASPSRAAGRAMKAAAAAAAGTPSPHRAALACDRLHQSGVKLHKRKNEVARHPNAHGHSFKPTLLGARTAATHSAVQVSRLTGQARLNRMHESAATIAKKKKANDQLPLECTFTPRLTEKGRTIDAPSLKDRFVHAPSPQKKLDRLELRKQERLETEGVTFQPKIFSAKKSSKTRARVENNQHLVSKSESDAFYQQLHDRAKVFDHKLKVKKKEQEAEEMRGVTFTPELATRKTGGSKKGAGGIVVHQKNSTFNRLYKVAAEQQKDIAIKRKNRKAEEMEDVTFTPDLSATASHSSPNASSRNAAKGGSGKGRRKETRKQARKHGRTLHAGYKRQQEKLRQQKERQEAEKLSECTFAPQIGATTATDSRRGFASERRQQRTEVWARLTTDRTPIKLLREEMKRQKDLAGCTFSPNVSARAQEIGYERAEDDAGAIGSRLHEEAMEAKKMAARRERLRLEREMDGATFNVRVLFHHRGVSQCHTQSFTPFPPAAPCLFPLLPSFSPLISLSLSCSSLSFFQPSIPQKSRRAAAARKKKRRSAAKKKNEGNTTPIAFSTPRSKKARSPSKPPPLTPSAQSTVEANACAKKDGRFSPKEIDAIRSKLRAASYIKGSTQFARLFGIYQAKRKDGAGRPLGESLEADMTLDQFKNMLCKVSVGDTCMLRYTILRRCEAMAAATPTLSCLSHDPPPPPPPPPFPLPLSPPRAFASASAFVQRRKQSFNVHRRTLIEQWLACIVRSNGKESRVKRSRLRSLKCSSTGGVRQAGRWHSWLRRPPRRPCRRPRRRPCRRRE